MGELPELVQNVMGFSVIGTENPHLSFLIPVMRACAKVLRWSGAQSFIGDESGETAVWISWDRINEQPERSPGQAAGPEPASPVRVASLYFIRVAGRIVAKEPTCPPVSVSSLLHLATELQEFSQTHSCPKKDLISQTPHVTEFWPARYTQVVKAASGKSVSLKKKGVILPSSQVGLLSWWQEAKQPPGTPWSWKSLAEGSHATSWKAPGLAPEGPHRHSWACLACYFHRTTWMAHLSKLLRLQSFPPVSAQPILNRYRTHCSKMKFGVDMYTWLYLKHNQRGPL